MAIHETKWLAPLEGESYVSYCDSLTELQEVAMEGMRRNNAWHDFYSASFVGRKFFNMQGAVDASNKLWQQGMDVFHKMVDDLAVQLPKPKSTKRQGVWSEDTGDEVDLDRLRRGVPYWRTTRREMRPGSPVITLITTPSSPCLMDWKDILWRGAATIAIAKALEDAGYRTEIKAILVATHSYDMGTPHFSMVVNLKGAGDVLDESSLVNCLSGWAFRTLWFGAYNYHRRASVSYGRPITGSKVLRCYRELCPELAEDGSNYLMVGDHTNTQNYSNTVERAKGLLEMFISQREQQ